MTKKICFVSPTFNESDNIDLLLDRVYSVWSSLPFYEFSYIFIDNASTDDTVEKIKKFCAVDPRIKLIVNNRNFGHIRSPYWGILQSEGDATIYLASDLQDPPELAESFIKKWEGGDQVVLAVKPTSKCGKLTHLIRKLYYRVLNKIAEVDLVNDSTGFGLYDKEVINKLKGISDPYPYLRGLIAELGFKTSTLPFEQNRRLRGISKNNAYTLYDIAMLGFVSHSLVPIRIFTIIGFLIGVMSFIIGLAYLIFKIVFWDSMPLGYAPFMLVTTFMFGFLFFYMGILGEYIGSIQRYVKGRPVVVEKERVNF